jgi:hypothetical protein
MREFDPRTPEGFYASAMPPPPVIAPRPRGARTVLAVMVVFLALVAILLGVDDLRYRAEATDQAQRAGRFAQQLAAVQAQERQLQAQVAQLQVQARNPTLTMWNTCGGPCTIGPNGVRVGSAPDTFELDIEFTSTVPVTTYFFTFRQWAQFDSCGFDVRCVTGSYQSFAASTSLNRTFQDAEGCSGYVWVMQASRDGIITPNVKIRYAPASHPTGVCAESP